MNILIIGAGGREHALAWKAAQSPLASRIFVAPGNGGTAGEAGVENIAIDPLDADALARFAAEHQVGLTIVGPEAPLVAGVADAFAAAGLACFGPSAEAARLEGSKAYAKDFLARHRIPTAAYRTFSDRDAALSYARQAGAPLVIKADGLAAGKGVILAGDLAAAEDAIDSMLGGDRFGAAGRRIVVEEWLRGEEASFIVMVDGEHILPLATSQDHKARDEGDLGPNTGGMGAYSPAPVVTPAVHERIMREIIEPTVAGLRADGIHYRGFLYAGLMIDEDGNPKVLEYNCRLGDPEAQPILMRLRSDIVELCSAAVAGRLDTLSASWDERVAIGVVMAAGGYPGRYATGRPISGLEGDASASGDARACKAFHAGTRREQGRVVTSGGRVLCATCLGNDIATARDIVYDVLAGIEFDDGFYRRDIAYRALARKA